LSRSGDVVIKFQETPWLLTPEERAFCRVDGAGAHDPYADVPLEDDPEARMPPPDDTPGDQCLSFAAWVDAQAERYEALGSTLGHWLGGRLRTLAETARFTLASTPAEFDDREQSLAADRDDQLRDQGYEAAIAAHGYPPC
jgi:hypothetical protein